MISGVRRGAHQGLNLYYMIYEQPLETFKHQQDIYLINVSISGRSKKSSASTFPISSVSLVSDFVQVWEPSRVYVSTCSFFFLNLLILSLPYFQLQYDWTQKIILLSPQKYPPHFLGKCFSGQESSTCSLENKKHEWKIFMNRNL